MLDQVILNNKASWFIFESDRCAVVDQKLVRVALQVYDVTHWHAFHPGGSTVLLKYGGRDATTASRLT